MSRGRHMARPASARPVISLLLTGGTRGPPMASRRVSFPQPWGKEAWGTNLRKHRPGVMHRSCYSPVINWSTARFLEPAIRSASLLEEEAWGRNL